MAKFKDGLFGPVSGKIDNLILSSRNGKPYVRSRPAQVSNPRSPKQLANRKKLSLLSGFLKQAKTMIAAGFPAPPEGKSSRDAAYSANYPTAFKGEYPSITLNYAGLIVSKGNKPLPQNIAISVHDTGLTLSWETTETGFLRIFILREQDQAGFTSLRNIELAACQADLALPAGFILEPQKVHLWISAASYSGTSVSVSHYQHF